MTDVDWKFILLGLLSIALASGFALLTKKLLYKYKRPNGKKGGIISFHAATAFSTVTVIALITKDWFVTGLAVLLAYLISRGKLEEGQHYTYQVVFGTIVGIGLPIGVWWLYTNKIVPHLSGGYASGERDSFEDKPANAVDDRHEADKVTELKIDDDLEL